MGETRDDTQAALRLGRDAIHALAYITPIGGMGLLIVAVLVRMDHVAAAWLVVAVGVLIGVAMATSRTQSRPRRAGRHSSTVRRINRRAAIILPLSAVLLATTMAAIAVKPVVLGLLGIVVGYPLAAGLAALGVHELLHALRRATVRRTES